MDRNALFAPDASRLRQQASALVYALLEKAESFFECSFQPPTISFTLRGRVAGQAHLQRNHLKFNNQLLISYGERFIQETVPHELAHILAYKVYGNKIKPHGHEWQQIMREVFQAEPKVHHNFQTTLGRKKMYRYQCACPRVIEFSIIRHRRAQTGTTYTCRICKSVLWYTNRRLPQTASKAQQKTLTLE